MKTLTHRIVMNLTNKALQKPVILTELVGALNTTAVPRHNKVQLRTHANEASASAPKQQLLSYPAFPLEETLQKFLKSAEPLLNSKELEETKKAIEDFQCNEGKELQQLLEKVSKKEKNWLADRWLRAAYMQFREPVTVYSSPGMTFPLYKFKSDDDYLLYAGKVVYGIAKYKLLIDEGKIPVVKMGKLELDNSQFGLVFGTCRIPQPKEDRMEYHPKSKHIVIIYKNHFYKLNIYDKCNVPLHPSVLAKLFKGIMEEETKRGIPIGGLTCDNRDNWAKAYEVLMKIYPNKMGVSEIQKSLFTVSLDDCVEYEDGKSVNKSDEYNVLSNQLIHGGGLDVNGGNRWMDKTIQVIVNRNGMSGFCYEHSPAEGQPVALITDYIVKNLNNEKHYEGAATKDYDCPIKLPMTTNSCLDKHIESARDNVNKLVNNLHMNVLIYDRYGKDFLKKQKLSPDSYVQMALQYAYYAMHKKPTAQYESAHLRIFDGGRTETIRSCSNESVAFAKAMLDSKCDDKVKADLLRKAVNAHRAYTTMALQGKGVDRHLLGLKLMAIENKKKIPKFFSCPGIVKSAHFAMSTSQVAAVNKAFMCYGPAVDNGYGCCYNPRDCDIILAISSWVNNKETDSDCFAENLSKAFDSMQQVLINAGEPPKAKL